MKGFTLIEMLIALMLMSMISAACLYGIDYWQAHTEALIQVNQLEQDIRHAQSLARHFKSDISLCGSDNGRTCDDAWSQGRLFIKTANGQLHVLKYRRLQLNHGDWQWRSALGRNDRLIFHSLGDNLGQQGSFYYCPKSRLINFMQRVVINQFGRVYSRSGQYNTVCGGK